VRLRISVTQWYILLLVCCAVLFALLAFHEFVHEPHAYAAGGTGADAPRWVAITEMAIYSCVPVILAFSWFLIRRTLRPLHEIARRIDAWDPELGLRPMEKSHSPETLEVARALARASVRLKHAFLEIREFSLRASHEIKTPLTILRGQAEAEARHAEMRGDEAGMARMEAQVEEIDRLARMVDGLGLLSKADSGMLTLRVAAGRLDELAAEYLEDIRVLAEPAGLAVSARIERPVSALYDSRRVRQAFLALAENAIKYNIPGGLIELGTEEINGQAVLWIENTGIPLSPSESAKVFEPFFRGPRTSHHVEGAGLGLSIARSLIEANGGSIAFQTTPAGRIRVAIQLPLPGEGPIRTPGRDRAGPRR
jgi:signal transduction histidine kinase